MRKTLIRKLHEMQKWRRGSKTSTPLTPSEFGKCIDDCIRVLRKLSDEQIKEILNEADKRE